MISGLSDFPVYPFLDSIMAAVAEHPVILLQAEPGAGKTTLVPWRLVQKTDLIKKKILLLQPRRLAARAAADRIAEMLDEPLGRRVGLRTRHETIISKETRLEVITEGILLRLLQNDQGLEEYDLVIFDEFHERSLAADLALTLTLDCKAQLRPDLKLMLMSATAPASLLYELLPDTKQFSVPGRVFPVTTTYQPPMEREHLSASCARAIHSAYNRHATGNILVFLPGVREINQTFRALEEITLDAEIVILHGRLSPLEQRAVLAPSRNNRRRIILATNIAETSLTLPGIAVVIDSGLERRVSFNPRTGMDHRTTARISNASATQRQGRAGRLGPGHCVRLWPQNEKLTEFNPPEIMVSDLAPLLLETSLWGASDPLLLNWLSVPPAASLEQARTLLTDLGFLDHSGLITASGRSAAALGIHPRLARMVQFGRQIDETITAAVIAAIIEHGDFMSGNDPDFRKRLHHMQHLLRNQTANPRLRTNLINETERILRRIPGSYSLHADQIHPEYAGILLVQAFPERVARRTTERAPGSARFQLATGRAALVQGSLASNEFIVAAELDGGDSEARVYLAAPIDARTIADGQAGILRDTMIIRWQGWRPRVFEQTLLGKLVYREKPSQISDLSFIENAVTERLHREGMAALPLSDSATLFLARCRFYSKFGNDSGFPDFSDEELCARFSEWLIPFLRSGGGDVLDESLILTALHSRLSHAQQRDLNELVPESVTLPSGTRRTIDYSLNPPVLAARLQEFFGCTTTPEICGVPLVLHLLSPAGRPVQITTDLAGFWKKSYFDVRKDLAGRYPKHYWPDNPLEAKPTARAKPRA